MSVASQNIPRRENEENSDDALAALVARGSQEAFSLLMDRYYSLIRGHAARLRTLAVDADDLAQEGLLGLYTAAGTFRSGTGAAFKTYASACIRNRMISALRRSESNDISAVSLDDPSAPPILSAGAAQSDPAQLVTDKDEEERLRLRLCTLLTACEYTVLMGHLSGYSYGELAERMRLSVKTVDNALQRVRRKLRTGQQFRSQ